MADNMVYKVGRHITVTLASKTAGQTVALGTGLTGVCLTDSDASNLVVIDTQGVYSLAVKGHTGSANGAVAVGDKVYLTDGEAFLDIDPAAVFFGYALAAVTSGQTTTIPVRLKG